VTKVALALLLSCFFILGQSPVVAGNEDETANWGDSTRTDDDTVTLKSVQVTDDRMSGPSIMRLSDVTSGAIYAGKKSELIKLAHLTINTATNNARQAYSSVAGLNIWESDGAGLQLGIGGRGLSPDRTSNFTVRQNSYDISADPLGYPESYYTPPLDFVERIEIVRGGGALRYGTQFGGVVNFIMKPAERFKPLAGSITTGVGSFGFMNAGVMVSGTEGALSYSAMYQFKRSNGWRPNSEFDMHTAYANISVAPISEVRLTADYTFMTYLAHQPGGLTDRQFEMDPSVSLRSRNWFTVQWNLLSFRVDAVLSSTTSFRSLFFGNISGRTALGNLDRINMADLGGPRTMIDGAFKNVGNETTLTQDVTLFDVTTTIVAGFRLFRGRTHQQQGNGSDGSDADFTFVNPDDLEGSDYRYPNDNAAVFAEGLVPLTASLSLIPGIRAEHITTRADGSYRVMVKDLAGNVVVDTSIAEERTRSRTIFLAGIGTSWKVNADLELYGNLTQNYRSITFNDLRITNPNIMVDTAIHDERGFTVDLGLRGTLLPWLSGDASIFYLRYNDRIGEVLRSDQPPHYLPYRYRTNVGDAFTAGLEAVVRANISSALRWSDDAPTLELMCNGSVIDGRYVAPNDPTIDGNQVELVPPINMGR
jgi:Fe(3+) dicitrate transport protein